MIKRNVKFISVIAAIVTITLSLCVVGLADSVASDSLFGMNTPTHITPNSSIVGTIESKKDYEAYIFEIEKNGALTVRLDHDNLLDSVKTGYVVTLYKIIEGEKRTYSEITYFESFWSDATASWGEIGVTPGTYCVVVNPGKNILRGDFTLVTMFTATEMFEKEINDTKATATPISVRTAFYGSSSQRTEGYDHDWYVFTVSRATCVELSFLHEDLTFPKAGWNIKILNEKEEVVCDFTSKLTDTLLKTGTIGLRAGTYYIKIESVSAVATTYSFVLGAKKAVDYEYEINDTPARAVPLDCDVAVGGSLADRRLSLDKDYFKIDVPANGVVDIEFAHDELEGNKNGWNIRVLKEEEDGEYFEIVKKVSKWNSKGYTINNLGLAKGEYYILIDGDSLSYNSATYTCKWTFTKKSNFEKEPNGIIRRAKDISVNKFYYGAIISSDMKFDTDYYKFVVTEETNYSLELGHEKIQDSSLTWVASIVDEDNDPICSVESSLNEGLVSTGVVTLLPGTYYVKVETGMYGSEAPYYFRLVR